MQQDLPPQAGASQSYTPEPHNFQHAVARPPPGYGYAHPPPGQMYPPSGYVRAPPSESHPAPSPVAGPSRSQPIHPSPLQQQRPPPPPPQEYRLPPPGYHLGPPNYAHYNPPGMHEANNLVYVYGPPPTQPPPAAKRRARKRPTTDPQSRNVRARGENSTESAPSGLPYGLGPPSTPTAPSPVVRPPPMSTPSFTLATEKSNRSRTAAASDVWYFVRPVQSKLEPSEPPILPETLYKERPKDAPFVACRFCRGENYSTWANNGGSPTAIRNHMTGKHYNIYRELVLSEKLKGWEELDARAHDTAPPNFYHGDNFSFEEFHNRLVKFIAAYDAAVDIMENLEFRDLLLYTGMNNISDKDVPHRTKLTELIYLAYGKEHGRIVDDLAKALGRIAFTADMWSRGILQGYMAITAHYLVLENGHLTMRSRLVAFRYVPGSHDGESMAKVMVDVFDELKVAHKISGITLDNAASNGTMMVALGRILTGRGIRFHATANRLRCFPHVINIAVKTGLKYLGMPYVSDDDPDVDPEEVEETLRRYAEQVDEEYEYHLESDLIKKARELMAACRSSGQRREGLAEVIQKGNEEENVTQRWDARLYPGGMRVLQLLRDVDTRWSSLYLMVERVLYLYPAIEEFVYKSDNANLESLLLSEDQRKILGHIQTYLQSFHLVQEIASAQKTPTLSMILPLFEKITANLRNMRRRLPGLSHAIDASLAKIEEYTDLCRESPFYGLAICLNHRTKFTWIQEHWSHEMYKKAHDDLRRAMLEHQHAIRESSGPGRRPHTVPSHAVQAQLSGELQLEMFSSQLADEDDPSVESFPSGDTDMLSSDRRPTEEPETSPADRFANERADEAAVDAELQKWIAAGTLSGAQALAYDPLRAWEKDENEYPIMYRVALDVLPIQASAVPCERAFSSSKETDADRRSRMSSALMEVLQILKGIYRDDRLDFGDAWISRGLDDDPALHTVLDVDAHVLRELLAAGKLDQLEDLIEKSYTQ